MASVVSSRTILTKRRNGKLPSCEPCRKQKLSCDHHLPACGRCVRRKATEKCYYHPAPLTRSTQSRSSVADEISMPIPLHHSEARPMQQAGTQPHAVHPELHNSVSRPEKIQWVASAGILMETSTTPRDDGFLGESSSSAVVAELNSSLGIETTETMSTPESSNISEVNTRSGIEVLTFFLDVDKTEEMLNRSFKLIGGQVFQPIYRLWWEHLAPVCRALSKIAGTEKLEQFSHVIWRNTQRSLVCDSTTTATQYALMATGENIRWETLGLLLSMIGALCGYLPGWDPVFKSERGTRVDKMKFFRTTMKLADTCVDLSKACGSRNDLLACLMFESVLLTAQVQGITSSEVWQAFGDLSGLVILMGLHLGAHMDAQTPFFLCELRLRLFNAVYSMDKFLATFLGRPPHISSRYSLVEIRHDLSDEQVCMEEASRLVALSKLRDGWTTTGYPHLSTWRRAWSLRHTLREDVLEIVIGPHLQNFEARISAVRAREREALEAMPEFLQLEPQWLADSSNCKPWECEIPGRGVEWRPLDVQCYLSIHRGIRHSDFLLERAIVNKQKLDPWRLIEASRSLLKLVLQSLALRDFLRDYQVDFTDMLAFYAVPPAGVLAMEMLRRDQMNDPADNFPRSETIQQLTVLVPALEAVRPDEGNYSICSMGLNAIRKVLDRLIAEPQCPIPFNDNYGFNNTQFGASLRNDADFSAWLGTVDFDSASWLQPPGGIDFSGSADMNIDATNV